MKPRASVTSRPVRAAHKGSTEMADLDEVAALLHVHEKASAHGDMLKNIANMALLKLKLINDEHAPMPKKVEVVAPEEERNVVPVPEPVVPTEPKVEPVPEPEGDEVVDDEAGQEQPVTQPVEPAAAFERRL